MNFKLRPYDNDSEAERLTCVDIFNEIWPEREMNLTEWEQNQSRIHEDHYHQQYMVDVEGQPVAMGSCTKAWWTSNPGKFQMNLFVPAGYRNNGIGTTLLNRFIEETTPFGLTNLSSWTRENQTDGIRFLQKHGFEQGLREPISEIDSAHFDGSRYQDKIDRVLAKGIQLKPLAEIQPEDPDWQMKAYDTIWELLQDVPMPEPLKRYSFDEWRKRTIETETFLPEGWFIAVDDGRWVGLSQLWQKPHTTRRLSTGLTGVVRSHRRMGIATALKVKAIEFAKAYGPAIINTGNEENNPMYQLNLELGFEPRPAGLGFAKKIEIRD